MAKKMDSKTEEQMNTFKRIEAQYMGYKKKVEEIEKGDPAKGEKSLKQLDKELTRIEKDKKLYEGLRDLAKDGSIEQIMIKKEIEKIEIQRKALAKNISVKRKVLKEWRDGMNLLKESLEVDPEMKHFFGIATIKKAENQIKEATKNKESIENEQKPLDEMKKFTSQFKDMGEELIDIVEAKKNMGTQKVEVELSGGKKFIMTYAQLVKEQKDLEKKKADYEKRGEEFPITNEMELVAAKRAIKKVDRGYNKKINTFMKKVDMVNSGRPDDTKYKITKEGINEVVDSLSGENITGKDGKRLNAGVVLANKSMKMKRALKANTKKIDKYTTIRENAVDEMQNTNTNRPRVNREEFYNHRLSERVTEATAAYDNLDWREKLKERGKQGITGFLPGGKDKVIMETAKRKADKDLEVIDNLEKPGNKKDKTKQYSKFQQKLRDSALVNDIVEQKHERMATRQQDQNRER